MCEAVAALHVDEGTAESSAGGRINRGPDGQGGRSAAAPKGSHLLRSNEQQLTGFRCGQGRCNLASAAKPRLRPHYAGRGGPRATSAVKGQMADTGIDVGDRWLI